MKTLSNNVFDRDILNKNEFEQMIDYLIKSIELLNKSKKTKEKEKQIDLLTISTLFDFGIINEKYSLEDLLKEMDEGILQKLIIQINKVKDKEISNIKELKKFHFKSRLNDVWLNSKENKPGLIDLFSGAGGLSLGLSQAGFKIIFANDIDKSALRTYSFNHPEVDGRNITLGGIEKLTSKIHNYVNEPIDLIVGGPPCQGFSNANRQRLIDDPRNELYKYYVDIVHKLNPKYFIMENVRGMAKVSDQVITDLNSNNIKYDIDYRILNAKDLGIPQNRERLIFIGVREDISRKESLYVNDIFERISNKNYDSVTLIEAISDLKNLEASRIKNSTKGDELSGYIIAENHSLDRSKYVDKINENNENTFIYNHKARFNNDRDIEIFSRMLPGDKSDSPRIADIMPYKSRNHIFKDKYYKLLPNKYCKTITSHMKFDCNMYIHPFQSRGLTPREAARVQSYPDNYFFLGAYTKTYQQIGNSVPPKMGKIIGENILVK
ncbi:DNA cytosine methyltransferase [Mammaliicoccus vitulinus]|uniref:DNA cytosine methyltransferase n=1 Tax=Mammaliicoccus vitulinus TaxID=71237 RepID=UPI002B2587A5|nr:DNA cytosine methyltransferase [Mammaliicoccus vitulinus]WQK88074.1 DNA cytosine methyltransferase [Mammaliicoccus vitulinus]